MSVSASAISNVDFDSEIDLNLSKICRDEDCARLDVHLRSSGCHPLRETAFITRSQRFANEPWRVHSVGALRESILRSVSFVEPRNLATVCKFVENDYGSVLRRSVQRHLVALRADGDIVRLDFHGRIHAYLRAGSRLISDPGIVLEQMLDMHAGEMAWA